MRLEDLKVGDIVKIKVHERSAVEIGKVIGRGRANCQLHGDFIDTTVRFRKHKGLNLRPSVMYELEEHGPQPIILEPADQATREAVALHYK